MAPSMPPIIKKSNHKIANETRDWSGKMSGCVKEGIAMKPIVPGVFAQE